MCFCRDVKLHDCSSWHAGRRIERRSTQSFLWKLGPSTSGPDPTFDVTASQPTTEIIKKIRLQKVLSFSDQNVSNKIYRSGSDAFVFGLYLCDKITTFLKMCFNNRSFSFILNTYITNVPMFPYLPHFSSLIFNKICKIPLLVVLTVIWNYQLRYVIWPVI